MKNMKILNEKNKMKNITKTKKGKIWTNTKRYLIISSVVINIMYGAATIAAPYAWQYMGHKESHKITMAEKQIAMTTSAVTDENALKPPETTLDSMPTKNHRRK